LKRLAVPFLALALVGLISGCATTGTGAESAVVRAKNKVAPAMVHIRPVKQVFARGQRREFAVTGSGFIISSDGYVVTNEHVAGESRIVRCVLSNKEEVEAVVVGTDRFTDLAVLKLETEESSLPSVRLGSSAALEPGQTVIALGSPHGLARSVSLGIVSVTDRHLAGTERMVSPFNNWIQTDAAINPGNSGGPLVNLRGEVIGVNTRKLSGADNVGFAIPIDIAREVANEIIAHGRVRRSWLGLTLQEMTRVTDDPAQRGVVVAFIDPLSPCAGIGITPGDIIQSINGEAVHARFIEDLPAIRKRIADLPVGEAATIQVARNGQGQLDFTVQTVEQSELRGEEVEFEAWGFTGSAITPQIARRAQLQSTNGVLVTGTRVGGIASNAGLNRWDVIATVDGQAVKDLAGFQAVYEGLVESEKKLILLDVRNIERNAALKRFVLVEQTMEENGSDSE
jgi:serine protease Do